jgi:predicted CoA-binding protein
MKSNIDLDTELKNISRICVVGVSRKKKFGNDIYLHLKASGYEVSCINSSLDTFMNDKCYHFLKEVTPKPELVILATKAENSKKIIEECSELGIKLILLTMGSYNKEILDYSKTLNVNIIYKTCPFLLFNNFGFHKLHKFVNSVFGIKAKVI